MNWVAFLWVLLGIPAALCALFGAAVLLIWTNEKTNGWASAICALLIMAALVGMIV